MTKIKATVQSQVRKSKIFSLWRSRQIDIFKNILLHASVHRIFLKNLLGSEQLQKVKRRICFMKRKLNQLVEKVRDVVPVISGAFFMTTVNTSLVMAADTSSVTKPLDNLKTLVIAIIGAIGVIILAKNVMEFAQAYQQQDSSTMNSALKGIVAGVMMAGISSVLTILGF